MLPAYSRVTLLLELLGAGRMALIGLATARGLEKHLVSGGLLDDEAMDELVLKLEKRYFIILINNKRFSFQEKQIINWERPELQLQAVPNSLKFPLTPSLQVVYFSRIWAGTSITTTSHLKDLPTDLDLILRYRQEKHNMENYLSLK